METTGPGFAGTGRLVAFVCLIVLPNIPPGLAQAPSDGVAVETFFNAIIENDTNTFFKMLEGDTNLTRANYYGRLPLHVAASKGRLVMVARLLERGADINAQSDTLDTCNHRLTALQAAIWYNHPDVCKLLLAAGADPNLQSAFDGSALHYAFTHRRADMADWLLDCGADPFLKRENPYNRATPLEIAITQGDGKLVPRMLGQDRKHPLGTKSRVKSPLAKSPRQPARTAADVLAERGVALLTAAAQRGELEAVQALLRAGVSARENTEDGVPLLQAFSRAEAVAAKGKDFSPERWGQIRQLLINNGAADDVFAATARGDIDQARRLFDADRRVAQAQDRQGQTLLHCAVQNDQLPLTSFWLQAGVSPAVTNLGGQTALHLAASKGLAEHVKLLRAAQAPTNLRDTNGWTPLDAAIRAQQPETIRLLLRDKTVAPQPERGIATPLHDAAARGNMVVLVTLLETTNNLEARNELGLTPLQVAVQHGHLAAAALLVDKGAAVNVRDPEGNTMLLRMIPQCFRLVVHDRPHTNWLDRMGQDPRKATYLKYLTVGPYEQGPGAILQVTSFLLACGIDVTATNRAGLTAIQLATDEKIALFDDREPLLKLLRDGGGNLNQADGEGNTALHLASTGYNDLLGEKVPALIASGADVNATNYLGRTALHLAVENICSWPSNPGGPDNALLSLIKARADVNARDNAGLTPLHVLALADTAFKEEAVEILLDAGANPNLRDLQGRTPAHLSLCGEWPWREAGEYLAALVRGGADLSAADKQGKTPLHYLAALGDGKPIRFIRGIGDLFVAAKVDYDARDNDGNTPLHIALKTDTGDVFDWLMRQGANLDATNALGETPRLLAARSHRTSPYFVAADAEVDIFQAIREGKFEAAARLIKADAELVNQTNRFGQTPLRLAAMMRRTNLIHFLESHGARWDETSAVMAGRTDALQAILKTNASAVATEILGRGLLDIAADHGDVDMIRTLIAANANLHSEDPWGLSPLGHALIKKHRAAEELLRQHGARENLFDAVYANDLKTATALLAQSKTQVLALSRRKLSAADIATAAGYTDMLNLLLKKGAALKAVASGGRLSLVHVAAFHNQTNALALLIAAGGKVNQADQFGFTPLHWAAFQGAAEAAAWLLKHQADANARIVPTSGVTSTSYETIVQSTPLHLAAFRGESNLVQLLLRFRADVNATNGAGQTPLDLATQPRMSSLSLVQMQHEMAAPLEPLGINPEVASPFRGKREGRKAAITLIEAAGGKPAKHPQPAHRLLGFEYPR